MDFGDKKRPEDLPKTKYHRPTHIERALAPHDGEQISKLEYKNPIPGAWYRGVPSGDVFNALMSIDGKITSGNGIDSIFATRDQYMAIMYAGGPKDKPFLFEIRPGLVDFSRDNVADPHLDGSISKEPVFLWMLSDECKTRIISSFRNLFVSIPETRNLLYPKENRQ